MTVLEAMVALQAAGGALWLEDGRPKVDVAEAAPEVVAELRAHREEVGTLLADVERYTTARCCRSARVWVEADRLHMDYRERGGRLDRAAFLGAVLADGRAVLAPGGLLAGLGLPQDWGPEDGGTLRRGRRGGVRREG